jgi:hypothetical protein
MTSSPLHRFGRSLAVAAVALLLIVGGAFAHGALAPTTLVTGPDPAVTTTGGDESGNQDGDSVDVDADPDTDTDDADEAEAPEAPDIEQPKLVEVKDAHPEVDKNDDQGEDNDDQGENEDHDAAEHDSGEHDSGDDSGEGGD